MRLIIFALFYFSFLLQASEGVANQPVSKVVTTEHHEWGYLNPLRGKLSPGAVNLWGDRTKNSATGMLVRFKKGFESPPHIHNITYRGVVIDGLLHNDDPSAEKMWMPRGSFWTQPAGESHITAANGSTNLIYLEIDSGPYLVKPMEQAFDNGERPLNLHKNNMVWLDQKTLKYLNAPNVKAIQLWGDDNAVIGQMIKLPGQFSGVIASKSSEFRAVLISGKVSYRSSEQSGIKLDPGSYFESTAEFDHLVKNLGNEDVILYIRTDEQFEIR
ncbi:hypothetical protein N473_25020 [Pseudoalteromonas luteoviolacea CPMOR-1]|uniref:DUF4437 domain-containing protein n=1 Tax=Pseudoalteromonas luteoviolacea CPMOR-1 TaxID=1365248 RepID=A0A167IYI9_9GAMM|nr:DUF4437 domain-containing protein [Pseudoalteromonas luteoviolacea]KZN60246.1 hypothetical protein N473_25020 [Pseudoalteromonas luteoviolacea CPMOR-1]